MNSPKPETDVLTTVTWQKDMHKFERDMYLSFCALLSMVFLIMIVREINEHNRLLTRVHSEMKARPLEERQPDNPQDRRY